MSMASTFAGGAAARVAVDNRRGRMTASVRHHQFLVWLDDQEPGSDGQQGDHGNDGYDYGPDGPTRMPACLK